MYVIVFFFYKCFKTVLYTKRVYDLEITPTIFKSDLYGVFFLILKYIHNHIINI